jgi:hypothetical protein
MENERKNELPSGAPRLMIMLISGAYTIRNGESPLQFPLLDTGHIQIVRADEPRFT